MALGQQFWLGLLCDLVVEILEQVLVLFDELLLLLFLFHLFTFTMGFCELGFDNSQGKVEQEECTKEDKRNEEPHCHPVETFPY